jgi:hypothetical protein
MSKPELGQLVMTEGVAGQRMIIAHYKYPGESPQQAVFVGTTFGTPGPVVLRVGGFELFVDSPDRFGEVFDKDWVTTFYTLDSNPGTIDAEHAYLDVGNPVGRPAPRKAPLSKMSGRVWAEPHPEDELADREADRIDDLHFNRDGL